MSMINILLNRTLNNPSPENVNSFYIYLERYVNNGSPSGFGINVPEKYSPTNDAIETVNLMIFFDVWQKHICIGEIPKEIGISIPIGKVPIVCHPRMIEEKKIQFPGSSESEYVEAVPTASARTFFCTANQNNPYFIKCHYPWKVGRFKRDMPLHKWISSLERSSELYSYRDNLPKNTSFLHETSGIYHQGETTADSFGCIFRDFNIYPLINHKYIVIPAFALFATNAKEVSSCTLIDLIMKVFDFSIQNVIESFVFSVIDIFVFLSLELGMVPECNAQNVLYEISLDTKNVRVVIRDFEDFFIDKTIRREQNLHTSFCSYKVIDNDCVDFHQRRSFSYDFKLSYYLILPILKSISNGNDESLYKLKGIVKNYAKDKFAIRRDYFKDNDIWYAYPNKSEVARDSYAMKNNPLFR